MNAVKALLVTCCKPEVDERFIYRGNPSAVPSKSNGPVITIVPLDGGPPQELSYMGEESIALQAQKVQVLITAAAVGIWTLTILGQDAIYDAQGGDTLADIRDGLKLAVDALALPVTTANVQVVNAPGFTILADDEGVSLLASFGDPPDIPVGGQAQVSVLDDVIRKTNYNWGVWTVRVTFRDTPSAEAGPSNRILASQLASRFRNYLRAGGTLPVTQGLAYPYQWDLLQEAPARLSWMNTLGPFSLPELEGGVWTRGVALDVVFQTPTGISFDVPSLDVVEFDESSLFLSDP